MPRHRIPCRASVLLLNDLAETFESHLATAYLDKRTHHSTHHVAKEAVGLDSKDPFMLAELCPLGMHDTEIVGLHIGMKLTEAGEVNVLEKNLGSLVHFGKVKVVEQAPRLVTIERVLAGGDIIFIGTISGIETSMGIGLHLLHFEH